MERVKIGLKYILLSALMSMLLVAPKVYAHCPLCSAATVAIVAATRFYGVDDLIVGTFIGGFIISTAFWIDRLLKKKNKGKEYISFQLPIIILSSIVLTIATFYFSGLITNYSTVFGIDKILLGTLVGSVISSLAPKVNLFIRRFNGHKNYTPFQSIFVTIGLLSLTILAFYSLGFLSL